MFPNVVIVVLSVIFALVPGPGAAQAGGPGLGNEAEVGASVSIQPGVTWLGGQVVPFVAMAATLRLSRRVELGGRGVLAVRSVRGPDVEAVEPRRVTTSYGGMLLRWRPAGDVPGVRWGSSLHMGAGTARIRPFLTGAEDASENFLFLEPGVQLLIRQAHNVRFSLDGSYRVTFGDRAISNMLDGHVRGPVLAASIQFVRDP